MANTFGQPENIAGVFSFEVPTDADELLTEEQILDELEEDERQRLLDDDEARAEYARARRMAEAYIQNRGATRAKAQEIIAKTNEAMAELSRGVYEDEQLNEAIDAIDATLDAATQVIKERAERITSAWLEGEGVATPGRGVEDPHEWEEKYPLRTKDGDAEADAAALESFALAIERVKDGYGTEGEDGKTKPATDEDVAVMLGRSRAQLHSYRSGKARIPLEVCERLCELLHITLDQLRRGDFSGALSDGTTTDYLLDADIWTPEQVREVYEWAAGDDDTRRAVTHALKTWLTLVVMADEMRTRDYYDGIVRWNIKANYARVTKM